mgnify:CR=1 FL=1
MESKTRKRYIAVTKEDREFLAKAFKVTEKYVWLSLTYRENGGRAPKIRKLAILRGGVPMIQAPEMETLHDHDGYMRQYFPNGVMLETKKGTSVVDILKDGKVVATYGNASFENIGEIQAVAASL